MIADAETAILDVLQATLLNPVIIEPAIHRAAARPTTDDSTSDTNAAQTRERVRKLRERRRREAGNAVNVLKDAVTRNAVTLGERSSVYVTRACTSTQVN